MVRERVSAPRGEVSRSRLRALTAAAASGVLLAGLTVVVIAAGRGPLPVDQAVHEWALAHRTAPSTAVALALEVLGSGFPAYLGVAVAGAVACTPRRWRGALAAVLALAIGQLIRFAFAAAVARPRPPRSGWIHGANGWSFPSGHATTSAIVAGFIWMAASRSLRGWRLRLAQGLALAWAGAVGLSRIYLGVHWPTDVVAGWLLAGALVLVGWGLLADRWEALPHPATPDEADSA